MQQVCECLSTVIGYRLDSLVDREQGAVVCTKVLGKNGKLEAKLMKSILVAQDFEKLWQ